MGDIDLEREASCVVDGGDALRVLRESMLHHERVFRCQVLELHRLYWTQKNLMNDLSVADYGSCSRQRSGIPVHVPNKAMQDMALYMHQPMMSLLGGQTMDGLEKGMDFSSRVDPDWKRMFSGQYSADKYNGSVGSGFLHGNGSAPGEIVFDLNEPQFPLGCLKDYNKRNRHCMKTFSHRQGSSYAQEVIDLDGSLDMEMNKDDAVVSSFGQEVSSIKLGSLFTMKHECSSSKEAPFDLNVAQPEDLPVTMADTDAVRTLSNSSIASVHLTDDGSLTSKANGTDSICKVDFPITGHERSRVRQNCMVVESSSSQNSNSMVLNKMLRPNSKGFLDLNSLNPTEHSEFAEVQPNSYGSSLTSNSYNPTRKDEGTYIEKQVLGSDFKKSDTNFQSLSMTAGLQNLPMGDLQSKQVEHENSDEDTVSSKVHGDQTVQQNTTNLFKEPEQPGRFSTQENSQSTAILNIEDNTLKSSKNDLTIKSDTIFVVSCSASENPGTQTCGTKVQRCGRPGLEANKNFSLEKLQVAESDSVVLMAAQCLTCMSSANSNGLACGVSKVQSSGMEAEDTNDQPQCSSDSLELIVLSLPESCEEACSPPSRPRIEEPVKSVGRFNSRRGRQLRDFQRDILPGLVSLSRHEICEDMHAFTEIARLYENKRKEMSGNMCRRNRSTTVRNRRPRCR